MRSLIKSLGAIAIAFGLVLLAGSQRASAEEGWKYVDWEGHCSNNCTPGPMGESHCPCYEMAPIEVKG